MKITQHIVITDPEAFLKGNYYSCFSLFNHATKIEGWINCGEIELDLDVDTGEVLKVAADEIDKDIGKATAVLNVLEQKKAELLALPAPEDEPEPEYCDQCGMRTESTASPEFRCFCLNEETQDEIHAYENSRMDKS